MECTNDHRRVNDRGNESTISIEATILQLFQRLLLLTVVKQIRMKIFTLNDFW